MRAERERCIGYAVRSRILAVSIPLIAVAAAMVLPSCGALGVENPWTGQGRWLRDLESSDPAARQSAVEVLARRGGPEVVAPLARALRDEDEGVRVAAAGALWKLGNLARPAEPALRTALDDPNGWVALNSGGALERLGVDRDELEPAYRRVFRTGAPDCRAEAAKRLGSRLRDDDRLPAVLAAIDADARSRFPEHRADDQLREIARSGDREVARRLIEALENEDQKGKTVIASALIELKKPAKEAIPALRRLLAHGEPLDRQAAAFALGHLGGAGADALNDLSRALHSDDQALVRFAAADAIGSIAGEVGDRAAKVAADDLREAIERDRDESVRSRACGAIKNLPASAARKVIPALEKAAADDPGATVRTAAKNTLFITNLRIEQGRER